MLKALELIGFKSFADRTRFDFPDGITVVVGPNGSGKSNVVDAVKWVLGAQSAKSLRGSDMADVIFKGSAEGGRKPANSAEAVLILDNTQRLFSYDADEVHVSRRVFRSGEGEYAINGEPCRLKDVKDLFRGTGVGVDAYSLIEQGKVDRLLQASAKDRRGIFEEAAGISRFKAKKAEAERRIQRVDQNMLRLSDIVDEVGKRLAALKGQATKAQRYREMNQMLQTKRKQIGWLDRWKIVQEQERLQKQVDEAKATESDLAARLSELQATYAIEDARLVEVQAAQDAIQTEYLEAQTEFITAENGHATMMQRTAELSAEQSVLQERIEMLQHRATISFEEIEQKQAELIEIQQLRTSANERLKESETQWSSLSAQLDAAKNEIEATRREYQQTREMAAENRSQLAAYRLHIEQLQTAIDQHEHLVQQSQSELNVVAGEVETAKDRRAKAVQDAESATIAKLEAAELLKQCRARLTESQEQYVVLQGKSHGVRERLHVLEQLEEQFTGAGRGGQQLLRLARTNHPAPIDAASFSGAIVSNAWGTVLGLVADLLTTEMHLAPLIDVALGTHADAIVLSNGQIIDWINDGSLALDGRVTLLRMDRLSSRRSGEKIQLDGLRGVLGRADRMTRFDAAFEPMVRSLLGTTWFVDTLSTALELSHFRGAGLRFVTAECQLVDSDGSITLGSLQTGLGLVSRRSEMQSAREEIKHVESSMLEGAAAVAAAQEKISYAEGQLRHQDAATHSASRELTACDLRLESCEHRYAKVASDLEQNRQNLQLAMDRLSEVQGLIEQAEAAIDAFAQQVETIEQKLTSLSSHYDQQEQAMQRLQSIVTDQRIELARLEQRVDGLRTTLEQLQQDSDERAKHVQQSRDSLAAIAQRIEAAQANAVEFQSRASAAQQIIQSVETRRADAMSQVQAQNAVVQSANRQCETARRSLEKGQDRIQALEQQAAQFVAQWLHLHEHYLAEYQIDLHELASQIEAMQSEPERAESAGAWSGEQSVPGSELQWLADLADPQAKREPAGMDRATIEAEIVHLRQEIASAGSVNMEALAELDELQARFDRLSRHHQDLNDAKATLLKTMAKIDEDSRGLFMQTLQTIRTNFQELYRRSFGGGFADIVLEDERDPESGIEIIATPPGKTPLSNSLLSGGEKALTAVALIMAFFQYRPSPFCILDEVDAPFDEANIGRFVTVLREFLDTTKFIVVTHSKKTMTAANMIYGITMQESGVSRQVSVRFEEVNDKGEIEVRERRAA